MTAKPMTTKPMTANPIRLVSIKRHDGRTQTYIHRTKSVRRYAPTSASCNRLAEALFGRSVNLVVSPEGLCAFYVL